MRGSGPVTDWTTQYNPPGREFFASGECLTLSAEWLFWAVLVLLGMWALILAAELWRGGR
jgi:hypothetical protein